MPSSANVRLVVAFQEEAAIIAEHARLEKQNSGAGWLSVFFIAPQDWLSHSIQNTRSREQLQQVCAVAVVVHRMRRSLPAVRR